MNHSRDSDPYK